MLGASGMMGHMVCRVLGGAGHDLWGTTRGSWDAAHPLATFLPRDRCLQGIDVASLETVDDAVGTVHPDAVINAVGIVKQLDAARDAILSIQHNALFPHQLAAICRTRSVRMVHLSTDCVFSGRRGAYTEEDEPDPVDLYGRTKLLGEVDDGHALVLRTSIVGRQLQGQTSLFEWAISHRGEQVAGYTEAVYSGLTTMALSRIIERVLAEHEGLSGVVQVASDPITKCKLLGMLNERLDLGLSIQPTSDLVCDRSLDGSRFYERTGIAVPSWSEMLDEFSVDQTNYADVSR